MVATVRAAGFGVRPYHAYVPSFGEWGFVFAGLDEVPSRFRDLPAGLRFLDEAVLPSLFVFPRDLAPGPAPLNRLDNQALVTLYEDDWRDMGRNR